MIERTLRIPVSVDQAFAAWVQHIDLWWPRDHRVSGQRDTRMVLEPSVGGRFYERTAAGDEHAYGEVTHFEPPHRLGYTFVLGTTPALPTHVDVQFVPDDGGTRVEVRHAAGSAPRWAQTSPNYARAWDQLLDLFRTFALEPR